LFLAAVCFYSGSLGSKERERKSSVKLEDVSGVTEGMLMRKSIQE
jgi:hypothetical protein